MKTKLDKNNPSIKEWINLAWEIRRRLDNIYKCYKHRDKEYWNEDAYNDNINLFLELNKRELWKLESEDREMFIDWINFGHLLYGPSDRLLLATKEFYPEHPKLQTQKYKKRLFDLEEIIRNTE